MHRSLALLLIQAVIATSGAVSLLHTHIYYDHDHPEHQHRLALHEHHPMAADSEDGTPRLEGCNPGEHEPGSEIQAPMAMVIMFGLMSSRHST